MAGPNDIITQGLIRVATKNYLQSSKGKNEVAKQAAGNALARKFANITDDLVSRAGLSRTVAPWATAQLFYESNNFKDPKVKTHYNPGGIKYSKTAVNAGIKVSPGNKSSEGDYYAKYASADDFYKDYARILRLGANPAGAASFDDFFDRLYKNTYFTDNPAKYKKLMQDKLLRYAGKQIVQAAQSRAKTVKQSDSRQVRQQKDQHKRYIDSKKLTWQKIEAWWKDIPIWGKVGIGAGIVYLVTRR